MVAVHRPCLRSSSLFMPDSAPEEELLLEPRRPSESASSLEPGALTSSPTTSTMLLGMGVRSMEVMLLRDRWCCGDGSTLPPSSERMEDDDSRRRAEPNDAGQ
jgi:hypothetical protein